VVRPLKFETPEILQQKVDEFFDLVKEGTESPSVIGLACYLETNKQTLLNYQDRDDFRGIIEAAKERIENLFTIKAYNGDIPPAIFIFTAKNHYEYKDAQDFNHGGQKGNPIDAVLTSIDGLTAGLPKNRKN
jgi:hypothetical protein